MEDPKTHMQQLSVRFQDLQKDLSAAIQSRQKLEAQREENLRVKQEFDQMEEDEVIYKLVGPVLVKQDGVEAESIVKGRLELIAGEIGRSETQIKNIETQLETIKSDLLAAQNQQQPGGKVAAAATAT